MFRSGYRLDTLSQPDISVEAVSDSGPHGRAWTETRALCEEEFHPLIDALIAAGAPGPDCLGDDIVVAEGLLA